MSSPTYYFINSTRNEFCSFDDALPILQALTNAVGKHGWQLQDNIKVESENSNYTFLVEYLINDKKFKNLDMYEELYEELDKIDSEQTLLVSTIKTMLGYS